MDPFTTENIQYMMEEYIIANINFHNIIIKGSQSVRLIKKINNLYDHLITSKMRIIALAKRGKRSFLEHKKIIEAINDKDSHKAEKEMRNHIYSLRKDFIENL